MGNAHREPKEASTSSRGQDELAKKDGHESKDDGEPLFVKVGDGFHHQAAEDNGSKAAGPPIRPISVSSLQGGTGLAVEENGFFPLCRAAQHIKPTGKQENCYCHIKTHCDGIPPVKERRDGDLPLIHPLTNLGIWVCEDRHRRPISNASKKLDSESNKTARQVEQAFTHSFHNSRDNGPGDFTSINFRLEDFDDAKEDLEIHRSTLSLPSTRVIDLEAEQLRPLTPPLNGCSLFMTSQSLGVHLTPYGEQMVLNSDSFTDLSYNLESWMSLLPDVLQHLPLNYLYIPGENGRFAALS